MIKASESEDMSHKYLDLYIPVSSSRSGFSMTKNCKIGQLKKHPTFVIKKCNFVFLGGPMKASQTTGDAFSSQKRISST
jgi:hypothetical protein